MEQRVETSIDAMTLGVCALLGIRCTGAGLIRTGRGGGSIGTGAKILEACTNKVVCFRKLNINIMGT